MTLSDRHLRGVYGIRDDSGTRVFVTTEEFWRGAPGVGLVGLFFMPWFVWAWCGRTAIDLQDELQTLALGWVAGPSRKAR